ncbi:MAG TPA: division plane positioning ATPase MipZ [Caulobacteraceae bacterium]|nr:division plane positioning ATPase MipZ [Caulobacteraceae bacterium]
MDQARVIVIGNEKGGAGKSTLAIHLMSALLHEQAPVAAIDLDLRQQSMSRFLASRRTWCEANGATLPMPLELGLGEAGAPANVDEKAAVAAFERVVGEARTAGGFVIIDTPGGDNALSRAAHGQADVIVTPMNDSFVDFDLLGQVDPLTLNVTRPSLYAETVWNSRKAKAVASGGSIDWIVMPNRLAPVRARNRQRLEERVNVLAKRVGFRIGAGLRERVIYRELHPFGLTAADLSPAVRPVPISLSHIAARQELRMLVVDLGLTIAAEPVRAAS